MGTEAEKGGDPSSVRREIIAFWCLGLLNNFLYVVMNAGASKIQDAGIGLVYLANILPALVVKLTGPYWFHYVPYKVRIWISAGMMTACLFIVAWGQTSSVKLMGVGLAAAQSGIGEASMLAMASFYDPQKCLAAWSSGTGFAGIFGYAWAIFFTQLLDACFQLQLMLGLWIPLAWLAAFHLLLKEPSVDRHRGGDVCGDDSSDDTSCSESETEDSAVPVTAKLTSMERFQLTLSLWPYMIPLFTVYASEYIIQAGVWAAMGFPPTDPVSRHRWYKMSNITYQVGVFISRSVGGLRILSTQALWAGPILQVVMLFLFYILAAMDVESWGFIALALVVGLLGGFVYVQAFVLISRNVEPSKVELSLSAASVADTFGIIVADICAILVQGCLFGRLQVMDTKPLYTCGYDIWDAGTVAFLSNASNSSVAHVAADAATLCFPGVVGWCAALERLRVRVRQLNGVVLGAHRPPEL